MEGVGAMMLYNRDKSYMVTINPEPNGAGFRALHEKIQTEGFQGLKGYFHAILTGNNDSVQINISRILPLQPW